MAKDKITMDDLTSGKSFDHWATANQLESLIGLTIGQPRYHKFMENFAKGMSSGKIGMDKAFRDAGKGMERFAPSLPIAAAGLKETGKQGTKAGRKLDILAAMTGGAATRLEQFNRSAARVDGTLRSTYQEFTSLLSTAGGLVGMFGSGIAGLTGLTKKMGGLSGKMGLFGSALSKGGEAIPKIVGVMSAAVGVVMGVVDDFGQSLRKTADFGISFGQSFMELRVELGKAGLGLDSLEKQLAQNSEAFALMGTNVHDGVRRFAAWRDAQNKLISDGLNPTIGYFENLGFAAEDLHDMFLKDFRNRRLSGASQETAIKETTKRLRELAKEAKTMSELTGESRKLLVQQNIEMRSDPQWQAFLGTQTESQRKALTDNLEMMATTMSFTPKQKKAIQDSIRMGGNISLLNESVFGDAFAFLRYMPEQRKLLENMVKDVAQGETIPSDLKQSIAGYIVSWGDFAKTEQGKFFSMYGKNIIPEIGVMFENLQAYNRILKKEGGIELLMKGASTTLTRSNVVLARQQQASLILSNIFASGKTAELMKAMTGTELEAALRGDTEAFNKLANIFETAGKAGGWLTQAIASMTIEAATAIINVADWTLGKFGLGSPGGGGTRVDYNKEETSRISGIASMFDKDGAFMFRDKSARGGRASGIEWRTSKTGGDRSIALQELLEKALGSNELAGKKMQELKDKYQENYAQIEREKADPRRDEDFNYEKEVASLYRDFKKEIIDIATQGNVKLNDPDKDTRGLASRIFRNEEIMQLEALKSLQQMERKQFKLDKDERFTDTSILLGSSNLAKTLDAMLKEKEDLIREHGKDSEKVRKKEQEISGHAALIIDKKQRMLDRRDEIDRLSAYIAKYMGDDLKSYAEEVQPDNKVTPINETSQTTPGGGDPMLPGNGPTESETAAVEQVRTLKGILSATQQLLSANKVGSDGIVSAIGEQTTTLQNANA